MPGASALVYAALARSGVAAALRRRDAATIFCFHNVVADAIAGKHGDPSLHIAVSQFATLLGWIARHFTVIPLAELVDRLRSARAVGGIACLTFDDAYCGTMEHAIPQLRGLKLPATVFIVADAAERPRPFWWDVTASLSSELRARYLRDFAGEGSRILEAACPGPVPALPADFLPADWATLERVLDTDIVPGSHTLSHRNLSALNDDEVLVEVLGSRERISSRLRRPVTVLSYPYGFATMSAIEAASRGGYQAAVTLGFGRARPRNDSLSLPRVNVPAGLPISTLECWASGLRVKPAPIRLRSDGLGTAPGGTPNEM